MTQRIPVGPICCPYDSGSGGTKVLEFIQYVDGQDPQMHEIWCVDSNGITREVHPTAQVDGGAGVVGHFLSHYIAENGRRIPIIGQISINGSVKLLGIPSFYRTNGLMFTENLLVPHFTKFRGDGGTPNQNCPVLRPRNVCVLWRGAIPNCPTYTPTNLENARAAARRVRGDWFRGRHHACMRSPSTSRNSVWNLMINRCGDDWESPVDQ